MARFSGFGTTVRRGEYPDFSLRRTYLSLKNDIEKNKYINQRKRLEKEKDRGHYKDGSISLKTPSAIHWEASPFWSKIVTA